MWRLLFFSLFAVAKAGVLPIATGPVHHLGTNGFQELHDQYDPQGLYNLHALGHLHGLHGVNYYGNSEISGIPSLSLTTRAESVPTAPEVYLTPVIQRPVITKEFYYHTAPDDIDEPVHKVINLGQSEKKYRVVFIKTDGSSVRPKTRLSIIKPHNEEKTVIYVLAKKRDSTDIETDIITTPTEPSKPEVVFIKYKTPEEAIEAERRIQAEYDALGGTSRVSDEGVAPVTSVVGGVTPILDNSILTASDDQTVFNTQVLDKHLLAPGTKYIPIKK